MKKLKSILVVFNGPESSNGALKQAIELANGGNCEVSVAILLPSFKGNLVLVGVKNIREAITVPKKRVLPGIRKEVNGEEGTQIQTILEGNNIPEAIIEAAKERNCDLIIIGRRGHKRNERAFMESVTARVIGNSPIDVLVVPKDTSIKWDNMLLAVDGSRCSEVATEKTLGIARNFKGELKVVSVVNVPDEAYGDAPTTVEKLAVTARDIVESVRDRAEKLNIKTEVFVREGEPHEKIVSLANHLRSDIICMGSYGRTGIRRLLMGSVTEKVIRKTSCPVLVVKAC